MILASNENINLLVEETNNLCKIIDSINIVQESGIILEKFDFSKILERIKKIARKIGEIISSFIGMFGKWIKKVKDAIRNRFNKEVVEKVKEKSEKYEKENNVSEEDDELKKKLAHLSKKYGYPDFENDYTVITLVGLENIKKLEDFTNKMLSYNLDLSNIDYRSKDQLKEITDKARNIGLYYMADHDSYDKKPKESKIMNVYIHGESKPIKNKKYLLSSEFYKTELKAVSSGLSTLEKIATDLTDIKTNLKKIDTLTCEDLNKAYNNNINKANDRSAYNFGSHDDYSDDQDANDTIGQYHIILTQFVGLYLTYISKIISCAKTNINSVNKYYQYLIELVTIL